MPERIENRMVVDSAWGTDDLKRDGLPMCDCCKEKIMQFRALRILCGKKRIWICDGCVEGLKEVTGFEE